MAEKDMKKLEQDVINAQKETWPKQEGLIEMRASEMIEEEKADLRIKAEKWSDDKATEKAIKLFEDEKSISNDMKKFQDEQIQLWWMFDQKALPEWDTAGQVMMKKMIGRELWLNTYQSITWLAFIKWKLAIWGKVFVWLITSAWYKIEFTEWTDKICKCTISKWEEKMSDIYTIEDAKSAWLYPSNPYSPWTKHTKKMLAYKVVNNISSFLCPHITWWALIADDAREELKGEPEPIEYIKETDIQNNITNKFKKND